MSHTWLVSRHAARPRVASRSARAPRRRLSQTPSTATESTRSYERALIESGPATRWTGAVELAGRVSSTRVDSRDTGIRGRRQNSYRTEGELTLRRMLTNLHAKDLQQPRRFPSEGFLATPAVLIPLAPAASHQNRAWSESLFLCSPKGFRDYRAWNVIWQSPGGEVEQVSLQPEPGRRPAPKGSSSVPVRSIESEETW